VATARQLRSPRRLRDPSTRQRQLLVHPPDRQVASMIELFDSQLDHLNELIAVEVRRNESLLTQPAADPSVAARRVDASASFVSELFASIRAKFAEDTDLEQIASTLQVIGRTVDDNSRDNLERVARISAIDLLPGPSVAPRLRVWQSQNLSLIQTVTGEHLEKVRATIQANPDVHADALARELQRVVGVSKARARLWARDQTLKLHADIDDERYRAADVQGYIWTTVGDEAVRRTHAELNGRKFSTNDPPTVRGQAVHPGQDYQCRCSRYPVFGEFSPEHGVSL
jgi:SPP1 gp7 family putative phage head morphogenesis protein